jgi:transcriptional regulator GlxA family with amidase domain
VTHTVGILLYDEVEVLDFAGPFEVFNTASRLRARQQPGMPPAFNVLTVAETIAPVRARGGLVVQPQYAIPDHPPLDVLIVPGGVHAPQLERIQVIGWIAKVASTAGLTASVCTGAFLLAQAGLLDGLKATTHWEDQDDMQRMFPAVSVLSEQRWVDSGAVISSAGISAGIDMSLHIVRRLEGAKLAQQTARQMEFDWEA